MNIKNIWTSQYLYYYTLQRTQDFRNGGGQEIWEKKGFTQN